MATIRVERLRKYFTVSKKEPGFQGTLRAIFSPRYSVVKAVDDISFSIKEGELVGFIGPNGAGKTTTLKVLSGLLYPTAGKVEVLGFTPWDRSADFLKQIALVMGQRNQLWWDLPAHDTFLLNQAIYEVPKNEFQTRLEELVSLLEVKHLLSTPVRKLSLGERMRMELVASLLHRPRVLFLDEPTIGLDLVAQEKIRDFIAAYNRKVGATILLTSHYMGDIERLASRVLIINEGKILFDGTVAKIIQRWAKEKLIKVLFEREVDLRSLAQVGKVTSFEFPRAEIKVRREVTPTAAAQILQRFPIADISIEETPIEEIVRGIFSAKGGSALG